MLRRRAVDVQPLVEEGGAALPVPPMPPTWASHANSIIIQLTGQQKTVAHLTVDVAFRYSVQADIDALRLALAKVLVTFPVLAGRVVRLQQDDAESTRNSELALCVPKLREPLPTWAYVSFVYAEAPDDMEPPRDGIAPDNLFDLATECIPSDSVTCCHIVGSNTTESDPVDESKLGAPLTRIRVTNYKSGCQVIALSINHTLVDAGSIGLFWSAWSDQYRSCRYGDGASIDTKVTFDHPIFSPISKEEDQESIPDEWKALLPNGIKGDNPFEETSAGSTLPLATCTIYIRTPEQIEQMKREMLELHQDQVHEPPFLSSNDVLCGEVCQTLAATSILLCMNWRPMLERNNFFGYALLFLYISLANAMDASVTFRRILGWNQHHPSKRGKGVVRSKDFVNWKMRNEGIQGKTQLIWNSWVGFFTVVAVGEEKQNEAEDADSSSGMPRMKMESYPHDIMMSEQMKRMRITVASKGISYAIVLPQPGRCVRVYFFGQSQYGNSLLSAHCS